MDSDRWKRINTIFHDALDLAPADRQGFVASATSGDEELQSEVEALLRADEGAGTYLESPILISDSGARETPMLPVGTLLCGRFRIIRKIAEGGMGQVYEASDVELKSQVALKVIRPEIASDPTVLARFRQEVKLARRITHPNVCRTYDFEHDVIVDEAQGAPRHIYFLTMEFLPGETLAARIRRAGALPKHEALAIARQIADAIDCAHSQGIIHRDLKPGNVMLSSDISAKPSSEPRAVITDFGLARVVPLNSDDEAQSISNFQGWPVGTMAYMSPEQLESSKVSSATDIYSFGLILFEMISGRRAFPAETFLEGISERISGLTPFSKESVANFPAAWSAAIESCLTAKPSERPALAAKVISALEGRTPSPILKNRFKSFPVKKVAWLLAPVLPLIPVGYFFLPSPHIRITGYKQLTYDGRMKLIAGTDGKWLYVTSGPGQVPLSRVPVDGGKPEALPAKIPVTGLSDWDVSQDGSKVLVGIDEPDRKPLMSLWSFPVHNEGSPTELATGIHLVGGYTPGGDSVIYSNAHGDIYQVRVDGTGTHRIASLGPGTHDVRMSPDGRVIRAFRDGVIWEMSANGSGLHKLLPNWHEPGVPSAGRWSLDCNLYVFWQVLEGGSNQLWAIDERRGLFRHPSHEPVQLTSGPIDWNRPVPGKNGSELYAMGNSWRGELSRIDTRTGQTQPFLGGISVEEVAFSPDGKSVTYTAYPFRVLWIANRDGTHAIQLTHDPINSAVNSRWSPDGRQILFMNAPLGSRTVAYTVSPEGGAPQPLLPDDRENESDPNWSPDGRRIVLTGGDFADLTKQYLRILDRATNRLTTITGSTGLWSPRWSPDGHHIAALTGSGAGAALRIFDLESQKWSELPSGGNVAYPTFSHDGKYLYYLCFMPNENGIYRVQIDGGSPELIANLTASQLASLWGTSFSLDPSDVPIVTREIGTSDVYSMQIEFK